MAVIAVVFDFDDTLVPDSTTLLFKHYEIDSDRMWSVEAKKLVNQGYDPPLAYLRLILDRVGPGKEFGELTNAMLRDFGKTLDSKFFPGAPELFSDLRQLLVDGKYRDITVEFYVISGGLEEVIAGSSVITSNFSGYYGCQFGENETTGQVSYIKRCITFTEKTRYLFEIHKGIPASDSKTKPHLVNQMIDMDKRRVPFDQMIYIGDGLTDIPCFSLINSSKGVTFGIFQLDPESAKQKYLEFAKTDRVKSLHSPKYGPGDDLGAMIRAAVANIATSILLKRERAGEL
jgi:phosphoserine phosphatase